MDSPLDRIVSSSGTLAVPANISIVDESVEKITLPTPMYLIAFYIISLLLALALAAFSIYKFTDNKPVKMTEEEYKEKIRPMVYPDSALSNQYHNEYTLIKEDNYNKNYAYAWVLTGSIFSMVISYTMLSKNRNK